MYNALQCNLQGDSYLQAGFTVKLFFCEENTSDLIMSNRCVPFRSAVAAVGLKVCRNVNFVRTFDFCD